MEDIIQIGFAAMRAQIGALQAQLDAMERLVLGVLPGPKVPQPCAHEDREDAGSTLGHVREKCLRCGEIIEKDLTDE